MKARNLQEEWMDPMEGSERVSGKAEVDKLIRQWKSMNGLHPIGIGNG